MSKQKHVTHTYAAPGVYNVALLARDKFGCLELAKFDSLVVINTPSSAFKVDDFDICLPDTIDLKNESTNLQNSAFYWNFGDGRFSTAEYSRIAYTEPGAYDITLTTLNEGVCSDTFMIEKPIIVRDTANLREPEVLALSVNGDQEIELVMKPYHKNNFQRHLLYRKLPTQDHFSLIDSIMDPLKEHYIDFNVETGRQAYEYKIQTHVSCNNPTLLADLKTYKSILLNGEAMERELRMRWSGYEGHDFNDYSVYRKNEAEDWTEIGSISRSMTPLFIDRDHLCLVHHRYKVIAEKLDGSNYHSVSNVITLHPKNNIFEQQHVEVVRSTVLSDNSILTEWGDPEIGPEKVLAYEIYRSESSDDDFYLVDKVPVGVNSYVDASVQPDNAYYQYKISVINTCDVMGQLSNEGTSILLQKESDHYQNTLFWNPYQGWHEGVKEYILQRKNEFGIWEDIDRLPPETNSYNIDLSQE
jgi:PKD repeat protein